MKKLFILALFLTCLNSISFADVKIAVVDIQAMLNKSAQIQDLRKEQETKIKELNSWLNTVKKDIESQKTKDDRDKLVKKYDAEFVKKQETIRLNYIKKLEEIDKKLTDIVVKHAQENGYDLVLSTQGAVIYGGENITSDLLKLIK